MTGLQRCDEEIHSLFGSFVDFFTSSYSRVQTTLDLYTDEDLDEMIAAQEKYLDAVGFEAGSIQINRPDEIVRELKWKHHSLTTLE